MTIIEQITKIRITNNGKVEISHSVEIIHRREYYDIIFGEDHEFWLNEYYIPKIDLQNKIIVHDLTLDSILFVPTLKFLKDEKYWIEYVAQEHERKYGHYKWYVAPSIQ